MLPIIRRLKDGKTFKIYFNKTTAVAWALFGPTAFFIGWSESVALVWVASVWANVKSDWATAEAADDRDLVAQLTRIEENQMVILNAINKILEEKDGCHCANPSNRGIAVLRSRGTSEYRSSEVEPGSPGAPFSYFSSGTE